MYISRVEWNPVEKHTRNRSLHGDEFHLFLRSVKYEMLQMIQATMLDDNGNELKGSLGLFLSFGLCRLRRLFGVLGWLFLFLCFF